MSLNRPDYSPAITITRHIMNVKTFLYGEMIPDLLNINDDYLPSRLVMALRITPVKIHSMPSVTSSIQSNALPVANTFEP